jgi:trimeric autotransporter adhesin
MIEWKRSLGIVVALAGFAAACGGSSTPTTAATVSSLSVTGSAPAVSSGPTSQFKATATMSDGTTQDVTSTAVWSSSNLADATVSATGIVTAVAPGLVSVSATYQSVTASDQIVIGA